MQGVLFVAGGVLSIRQQLVIRGGLKASNHVEVKASCFSVLVQQDLLGLAGVHFIILCRQPASLHLSGYSSETLSGYSSKDPIWIQRERPIRIQRERPIWVEQQNSRLAWQQQLQLEQVVKTYTLQNFTVACKRNIKSKSVHALTQSHGPVLMLHSCIFTDLALQHNIHL